MLVVLAVTTELGRLFHIFNPASEIILA